MDQFQDFVIKITPADEGSYRVEATSFLGEATGKFRLPFDDKDLKIFMLEVGRPRSLANRGRIPDFLRPTVDFGHSLYNAVITEGVRDLFVRSLHDAEQQNEGLRIRLRLNEAPGLAHLPWEFLYDGRDFLALSDASPLVRYMDLPNPPRQLAVSLPLRILVTISAPTDLQVLDVGQEKSKIEQALARLVTAGLVRIQYTANASLNTLQRVLRQAKSAGEPFHIWHYIGHGYFDPDEQTSKLALTNEQGLLQMVSGFELGTLLQNFNELRLALLNACEGARSGSEDPFAGVATALVEHDIPAVIAMQFEITDQAAIAFSSEFYAALVDGLPLDTAVTNARRTVFFMPNYIEWAYPVLYLRSPDSRIFKIVRDAEKIVPAEMAKGSQVSRDDTQRLASLYIKGLSDFYLERWESAVSNLQAVVAIQADYEDAAEKLAVARHEQELTSLYEQARKLLLAEDWDGAIGVLQQVVAQEPDYQDSSDLIVEARKRKQLKDLIGQAGLLFQAGQWQAVLTVFDRLDEIAPVYPDLDNLRKRARQNTYRDEQEQKLKDLYAKALMSVKNGELAAAEEALEQILETSPEDADAVALLEKVKVDRQREEKEQKLHDLYAFALQKINEQDLNAAKEALEQVFGINPQYEDTAVLLRKVNHDITQLQGKRQEGSIAEEQSRQLQKLYDQGKTAVRKKDWTQARSLLEQVQTIQPEYRDTADLLEMVSQASPSQLETGELRPASSLWRRPFLLLVWVGVYVLAWVGMSFGIYGNGLDFLFLAVMLVMISGIQWFYLKDILEKGAARWAVLSALGTVLGFIFILIVFSVGDQYIESDLIRAFIIGITIVVFSGAAGIIQIQYAGLDRTRGLAWILTSLVQGLGWFWFYERVMYHGTGYFVLELLIISILVGLLQGSTTGLALNWLFSTSNIRPAVKLVASPDNASTLDQAPRPDLKQRTGTIKASELLTSPISMIWWVGLQVLGWIVLGFWSFEKDSRSLIAIAGMVLIISAGQWFLLHKVLTNGVAIWSLTFALGILIGLFSSRSYYDENWMPGLTASLFFGLVLAFTGGLSGLAQSLFLPVNKKKRILWILVSMVQGIAWFLFLSINWDNGFYDYSEQIFTASLLAGLIQGAATGIVLNWILLDSDVKTINDLA